MKEQSQVTNGGNLPQENGQINPADQPNYPGHKCAVITAVSVLASIAGAANLASIPKLAFGPGEPFERGKPLGGGSKSAEQFSDVGGRRYTKDAKGTIRRVKQPRSS